MHSGVCASGTGRSRTWAVWGIWCGIFGGLVLGLVGSVNWYSQVGEWAVKGDIGSEFERKGRGRYAYRLFAHKCGNITSLPQWRKREERKRAWRGGWTWCVAEG